MGSVIDAIAKLREQSKYLHVLSHAHKTLKESSKFINKYVDLYIVYFLI